MYIILFLIIDQVAKWLAKVNLQPISFVNLIKGVVSLSYVENRGAAFGTFEGRGVFLIIVTLLLILVLAYIYYLKKKELKKKKESRNVEKNKNKNKKDIKDKIYKIGLELVLAGAIGNLIDRIFRGYVIDFIKIEFIDFPVFNFADIFIDVGAIFIIIYILTMNTEKKD